jgi:ring-1,2-phenylacetyl-CoA epoxidase subunit PaaE
MALFGMFKKDKDSKKLPKGFYEIPVAAVEKLTADTVKITLEIPSELKSEFQFIPGQYITISVEKDGKDEHRSYSICSGPNEPISFAAKAVKGGNISIWLNEKVMPGTVLAISKPIGNFILKDSDKNIVAIAAGSGVTPMMSIAKAIEQRGGKMHLFFGNRTKASTIFHQEINALSNTSATYFLTNEEVDGYEFGRINKDSFSTQIKANLDLLKADAFFLCGPEQMILDISNTLEFFGVTKSKIHFELFTTPVLMASSETIVASVFEGESKVKAILDGEVVEFSLKTKGKSLLEAAETAGLDAPYSCKGGVCCSCKAKIIKGTAMMTVNMSLTDKEIQDGYILTCQAHPTSEELTFTYDA